MKTTIRILTSGLMVLALVMVSCTKDSVASDIGPVGAKGEQGIQGEKGDPGNDGKDGTALGVPGDKGDQGEQGLQGDPGAEGTPGATGPKGDTGETGATGPAGEDGNANVVVKTLVLTSSDWLWNSNNGFSSTNTSSTSRITRYVDLNVSEIDAEVDQNGLVLVYFKATPNGGWQPLPFEFSSFGSAYTTHIIYETIIGKITIHYFWIKDQGDVPASGLATYPIADHSFKYVVVKGSTIAKNAVTAMDLKKMSYYEVMEHFGLED